MLKVLAKFIGTNTFLEADKTKVSYETNNYYVLFIGVDNGNNIKKQDGTGKCQYGSLKSFMTNWTDIKHINN